MRRTERLKMLARHRGEVLRSVVSEEILRIAQPVIDEANERGSRAFAQENEANMRLTLALTQRDKAFEELGWQIPPEPTHQEVRRFWGFE